MLYGRYRSCPSCQSGLVLESDSNFAKNASGTHFVSSCYPKYCSEGQVYQYNGFGPCPSESCIDRYELKENEKGVANDNGCHPEYNLDPLGICRKCDRIGVEKATLVPSDCVFFYTSRYIDYDFFVYSVGTYSQDQLSEKKYTKGETSTSIPFYETLFGPFSWVRLTYEAVILKEQKIRRIKDCYRFTDSHKDPYGYYLIATQGYYLQEINTIPGLNASKQIANVEPDSPLAKFYCMRTCEAGKYYDFEATYCRKCDIGCSSCTSFETCDVCIPGWNQIQNPNYSTHKIEYRSEEETQKAEGKRVLKPGMCLQGCQLGFFTVPFSGHCQECNKNCLKCSHKMVKHRYGGEENSNKTIDELFEGYCLKCRPLNDKKVKVYTEIPTGRCVESCEGRGQFPATVDYEIDLINTEEKKIEICVTCATLRCKKCEIKNTSLCLECYEEFYGIQDGKCVTFRESTAYTYLILGGIFLGVFSCLLLIVIGVTSILTLGSKKEEESDPEERELLRLNRKKIEQTPEISIKKAALSDSGNVSPHKIEAKSEEKLSLNGNDARQKSMGPQFGEIAEGDEEEKSDEKTIEDRTERNFKTEFDFYVRIFSL